LEQTMVTFGPEPVILHPCHLFGREMAQTQPPIYTLDPKFINVNAKVLHLCIETIVSKTQMRISGKWH